MLSVCDIIRSLNRVLLGLCLEWDLMWECCVRGSILGDILFICIGFIRSLGGVGELDGVGERWCGIGLVCCGS